MRKQKRFLARLAQVLRSENQILAGYLFGSQALKKANQESDLDVAIFVENKDKFDLREFLSLLARKEVLPDNLDLVVVDFRSSPLLLFQIIKTGFCFYQKRPELAQLIGARALHLYYDNQYLQGIYNRHLKRLFRENRYGY